MTKRKALSKAVRFEVFKRDRFTCTYCGKRPPDVVLEVDHIVPVSDGGADTIDNLTTSCFACNRGKSNVPLKQVAPHLDELQVLEGIQEMLERKVALTRQAATVKATREAEDEAIDTVYNWWVESIGGWETFENVTARTFVQRLELGQIRDAIDSTERFYHRKPWYREHEGLLWKYFCGACWTKIREGQNR